MTARRWARAAFLFLPVWAGALAPVPPVRRVTDLTGTLTPSQQSALEATLSALETEKGAQGAVLVVPTTQPEAIEQYALRVAETWKLGRKGVDDGVLLLVAKEDRTLRIEVGYGLEGALPDAVCKQIIDDFIVPRFRAGDFYGGIETGVGLIARRVRGEPLPAPAVRQTPLSGEKIKGLFIFWLVAFGFSTALFGKRLGPVVAAVGIGVVVALMVALAVGAITALLALIFGLLAANSNSGRGGGWSSGGRGWGGGGWSGGGGGFSGGGGGFGGGGASGRW